MSPFLQAPNIRLSGDGFSRTNFMVNFPWMIHAVTQWVQISSYYEKLCQFFIPHLPTDQTTYRRNLKFWLQGFYRKWFVLSEAIFEIRPRSRDTGCFQTFFPPTLYLGASIQWNNQFTNQLMDGPTDGQRNALTKPTCSVYDMYWSFFDQISSFSAKKSTLWQTDRPTDGPSDRWTDKASYRDALHCVYVFLDFAANCRSYEFMCKLVFGLEIHEAWYPHYHHSRVGDRKYFFPKM